jgi:hypothetical protein
MHQSGGRFKISAFFQEMICHVGQNEVFEESCQTIYKLRGVNAEAKQIERVCHYYGQQLEQQLESDIKSEKHPPPPQNSEQTHYAMMDGSMLLTREDGWKEVKLGRIFCARDQVEVSKERGLITQSQYVAHLGGHKEFLQKFDYHLEGLKNIVFINDGARWIWNWVEAFYPECTQILDFYHAKEHLCAYAQEYFKDEKEAKSWIEQQTNQLMNDQLEQVLQNIKSLPRSRHKKEKQARNNLINYYSENVKRMQYKTFKEKGFLIGSGAIESAHRSVIQHRLKLSGQRWTNNGAQQIINLRIVNKSNQWNKIENLTKCAA